MDKFIKMFHKAAQDGYQIVHFSSDDACFARAHDGSESSLKWFSEEPLSEQDWAGWAKVLRQIETKKKQEIFLENLYRPQKAWRLSLPDDREEIRLLVRVKKRPDDLAQMLRVDIPENANVRIIFVEDNHQDISPGGDKLRSLALLFNVARSSSLEVSYIDPLYSLLGKHHYLRKDNPKVRMYQVNLAADADIKWTTVNFGDSVVEKGRINAVGENIAANVGGAVYIPPESDQLYQAHVFCSKPRAKSFIKMHGVVEDGGRGHFVTISEIKKKSYATKVREENRFLTMGNGAKTFIDPSLLIEEHDVEASHQATVAQVCEDKLYYLQSRGLTRKEAGDFLVTAFLIPLLERISLPALRELLLKQAREIILDK